MISIITPTYNRYDLETRAISSVVSQTYDDWEYLISDASTNDRLECFVDDLDDDRIKFIKDENVKPHIRRYNLTNISKGEYLSYLDSDDYWDIDRLENHIKVWNKNLNIVLSWDDTVEIPFRESPPQPFRDGLVSKRKLARRMYLYNIIHMSNIVISKSILMKNGGFPLTPFCDFYIGIQMSMIGDCYFIKKPLSYRTIDSPNRVSYEFMTTYNYFNHPNPEMQNIKNQFRKRYPLYLSVPLSIGYFLYYGRKSKLTRPYSLTLLGR